MWKLVGSIFWLIIGFFLAIVIYNKCSEGKGDKQKQVAKPQAPSIGSPQHNHCVKLIRSSVKHPSATDIHTVMGFSSKFKEDGDILMRQDFTTQNTFGLKLTYTALCYFTPEGKFKDIVIGERPY